LARNGVLEEREYVGIWLVRRLLLCRTEGIAALEDQQCRGLL
jgi:hypothetical protein